MYSRELWISVHVCFRGGGRKLYVFSVFLTKLLRSAAAQCVLSVFLTKLLRSAQCVFRGRAPSLIRVLGATQARYYSDRSSSRRGELGEVGGGAESFIQLGRQR